MRSHTHAETAAAIFSIIVSRRLHRLGPFTDRAEILRALPYWPSPIGHPRTLKSQVAIPFADVKQLDFNLQPPPASNRLIKVKGRMDIISRVAFGHDWWGHPEFIMPIVRVGPYGRPGTPDEKMGQSAPTNTAQALSDYGSVRVDVTVDWQPDRWIQDCAHGSR